MKRKVIEHPFVSGFPFVELSGIRLGNMMRTSLMEEVVASSPVDVKRGSGSYFNTVFEKDGGVFVRTMVGRSDNESGMWVYAGDEVTELTRKDSNYRNAKDVLRNAA